MSKIAAPIEEISDFGTQWFKDNHNGRKINLSLIISKQNIPDAREVRKLFPPKQFQFRLRPYIPTFNGQDNALEPIEQEELNAVRNQFIENGFDVGAWPVPTKIEQRFNLVANSSLARYQGQVKDLRWK